MEKQSGKKPSAMKNFLNHARMYIFRGLLAIIPILLCVFALQLLYVLIDKRVMGFLSQFVEVRQIPGLGLLLVLVSLYLIGLIVSNILGRQLLHFFERITERIPFIKTIYGVGKQLSHGLSIADGEKQAFKKAILIKLENTGLLVPAFVTGSIVHSETKEEYLFVLTPTAPNPASGFIFVVKASQAIDPGWSIEDCLKAIVSVGIISPKDLKFQPFLKNGIK
ncbi:MAG: DUF502 domain-containing protein [Candidatus Omnitrophota bacterium]|nr:DUF502 domain-containing protein [Candidatus Omnitrophota bacterium]